MKHERAKHGVMVALGGSSLLLGAACSHNRYYDDNPDVAAEYRDNKYVDDMVEVRTRREYEDQGQAIKPATLTSIENTIATVYQSDFQRCLEEEMDELGTRFLRSAFQLEFHISTSGKASKSKILDIWLREQDAKGADLGERDPERLRKCILKAVEVWAFDPAPEAPYTHTYQGQVGEAY